MSLYAFFYFPSLNLVRVFAYILPPFFFRAPLSLERVAVPSVMESAETSANTRQPDPAADLREAMERNAREKHEEEEAARLEKAEADRAAASAQKKLDDAEAALAARRRAKEAARRRSAMLVPPLSSAPPPPEFTGQTGGAGTENPVAEKESGEASMLDARVPPPPPPSSGRPHGKQPVDPSEPPAMDEAEARLLL